MTTLRSLLVGTIAVAQRQQLPTESPRAPKHWSKWLGIILAVAAFAATMPGARARDDGRYAHSPHKAWFSTLTNQYGIMCCDDTDGVRLDDPDWEFDGQSYRVRIEGRWMPVPSQSIVRQQNIMSYAMVWPWKEKGQWRIRCFMAGSGT